MFRTYVRTGASMMGGAILTVPFTLNVEMLTEDQGASNLLVRLWHSGVRFVDLVIDPQLIWMFWLGIGLTLGAILQSFLRKIEEHSRGRLGGPPLYYLRIEAKLLRWAIKVPALRIIVHDFDRDLLDFNMILVEHYGFPPLPSTRLSDKVGMSNTYQYLVRIAPFLKAGMTDVARMNAEKFVEGLHQAV